MPELLEAASAWFEAYYRSQADDAPEDAVHLELKRLHCRKVMNEAAALAENLELSPRLRELAAIAGLCHDVGRFPQYRRYKTFSDRQSVNHARLGTATLSRHDGLGELPPGDRTLVRTAIVVHNRRLLPAALLSGGDAEALTLSRLVRDADKLDIVRIMLDHFQADGPKDDVVFLGQPDTGRCSPAIVDDILAGRLGSYENMASASDFALLILSWINDMAYPWTRRQFFARGHVQGLFDQLPDTPDLAALRTWYFDRHAPAAS